jgi:quinol monooxygenase YgiN
VFGLSVRFTCEDEVAADAFDRLVDETLPAIRQHEPGTLVYAVHIVAGKPLQRIFYELYSDRDAFDAHENQPHVRRFLADREQYLASVDVDFLTLRAGKGTDGLLSQS